MSLVACVMSLVACGARVNPGLGSPEDLVATVLQSGIEESGIAAYDFLAREPRADLSEEEWIECWSMISEESTDVEFTVREARPVPGTDDAFVPIDLTYSDLDGNEWALTIQILASGDAGRWLYQSMWLPGAEVRTCAPELLSLHLATT